MGTVSSSQGQQEDMQSMQSIPQNLRKIVDLKIDFNKEAHPSLRQLLFWSLSEIRSVYEKFQRRSKDNIAFLDKTLFCKIVPFTRTNALFIFENFSRNNKLLSIYEFLCVLILAAYTHYINKIHFLYVLFDLDCSGGIQLNELLIIFKSVILGYCKLTETPVPPYNTLEKFAKLMFLKSDIQADNTLELKEIIEWVESNSKAMQLFQRFEPKYKIKEEFEIFHHFQKYSEEDAEEILKQINKANKDELFYNDLQQKMRQNRLDHLTKKKEILSIDSPINVQKKQTQRVINKQEDSKKQIEEFEEELDLQQINKAIENHARKFDLNKEQNKQGDSISGKKQYGNKYTNSVSLPKLHQKLTLKEQYSLFQHKISKNIIIIKGNTLTRQDVFKLKDYFDTLSDKNQFITIKEFTKAFQNKPHMKRVTASLFNYLDNSQNGQVTFSELLKKLYPSLTSENMQLINHWISLYSKRFAAESKELILENKEEQKQANKRKRVLPRTALVRIKEIFDLIDQEKKGYLTLENLKNSYTYGFTAKEIEQLFQDHDKDNDGKLTCDDFVRVILPSDYIIEDKEEIQN